MKRSIERAKEIAREIESGKHWVDGELAGEMANLLDFLASCLEIHHQNFSSVQFALGYYSEPSLYMDRTSADVILDGGLRARTALGLLKKVPREGCAD